LIYANSEAMRTSPLCAFAGVSGLLVQILLTKGLELADAAKAMTMAYSSIVWAELAGALLFREYPNVWSLLGIAIIIGGTLYCGTESQAPATPRHMHEEAQELLSRGSAPTMNPVFGVDGADHTARVLQR
jgi:EamA-like transporter family